MVGETACAPHRGEGKSCKKHSKQLNSKGGQLVQKWAGGGPGADAGGNHDQRGARAHRELLTAPVASIQTTFSFCRRGGVCPDQRTGEWHYVKVVVRAKLELLLGCYYKAYKSSGSIYKLLIQPP
jgi:hypothetical protein